MITVGHKKPGLTKGVKSIEKDYALLKRNFEKYHVEQISRDHLVEALQRYSASRILRNYIRIKEGN